jgi:Mg2+ and Co2+ transporter CorA
MMQPTNDMIEGLRRTIQAKADEVQKMRTNNVKAQRISALREEVFRLQRQLGEELKRFNARD